MTVAVFEIQVLHSYFQHGRYQSCAVVADDSTQQVLDRYGFVMRRQEGSLACNSLACGDLADLLRYLNQQLQAAPLRFYLMADAAQFVFITNVPLDWVGQLQMDAGAGVTQLSQTGTQVKLVPELGPRMVNQAGVIGVISIAWDDLLNRAAPGIRYLIQLQARSVAWHYYLVNSSQTKLHDPAIRDRQQRYLQGPEPVVFPDGEKGMCFSSGATEFALQQVPTQIFDLIDRLPAAMGAGHSLEYCVISGLPTPSVQTLKQAVCHQNHRGIYGAMYVYL